MRGSKPLTDQEIEQILGQLPLAHKALFVLGLKTGFRISELLSLKIGDVVFNGDIGNSVTVQRCSMKGKKSSRTVVLHQDAKKVLKEYLDFDTLKLKDKLFPFSRYTAHRHLAVAVAKAGLEGKISTHSMRKSFAKKIYHALGKELIKTQAALGHASINSTVSYLSFEQEEIDWAVLNG